MAETIEQYLDKPRLSILKKKAARGGGFSVISAGISFVIQTVGVLILGRILGPEDFGVVTMISVFYLLLMNFGSNGFTEYIIQKKTIDGSELNSIFWLHMLVSFFLMLVLIAAGPALAAFYKEPKIRLITPVMASGIMLQMLSTLQISVLKRRMEYGKLAINNVLASAISSILAVVMALEGFGYWAVVARQLSIVAVTTIGVWIICPWKPGIPEKLRDAMASLKYALSVYGNFGLTYLARSLDKVLLGRFHGSAVLGNYDRAYYLYSMPIELVATPLHSVGLATLSRLRDDPARYSNYYLKALRLLSFIGVFASIILTVSGSDLVRILLGPAWEQAGHVVTAFGPGLAAMIIYSTHSWIHLSLARPDRWLRWSIITLLMVLIMLIVVAPHGPVYVASAYSLVNYLLLVPALWYAGKPIGLRITPIIKSLFHYFLAGLVTTLTALAAINLWPACSVLVEKLGPELRTLMTCVICFITYTGFVITFQRSLQPVKELLSYFKMFFSTDRK